MVSYVIDNTNTFLCFVIDSFFFFSSRRRHTRCGRDWSSDVCSSDLSHEAVEEVYRQIREWRREQAASGNGKRDRKSTRLNSSHVRSSYAVFCLKKKLRISCCRTWFWLIRIFWGCSTGSSRRPVRCSS